MRSYLLLLFCVTCWGSNFVFGSILVKEFPPMLLVAVRISFTTIVLFGYAAASGKLSRIAKQDWKLLLPLGFVGTLLNQSAFFAGLQSTDATTAALITSLAPITTALLAAVFLGEAFTKRMFGGSALALLGVFFVIGHEGNFRLTAGVALIFVAMLTFAASVVMFRKLTERIDPFAATVYSTAVGSVMLVPVAAAVEPFSLVSRHAWAWALALGTAVLNQLICGLIWNFQLKRVGAGKAAVFLNLQPFVAMVTGFLLLGTKVTLSQGIGAFLIIGGVITATVVTGKRKAGKPPVYAAPER